MTDQKYKIRKGTLYNRRMLDPEVWRARNEKVCHLASMFLEQKAISCFHVFLPIRRNNEVDLWSVVNDSYVKEHQIVVSATDFEAQTMSHFIYSGDLVFEDDAFGIPTPVSGEVADLSQLQLIFVPMLAGDKKGNRIGYGKGYYDRLLAETPSGILKVGLSLNPLFDLFPFAEPHDIALDYCITSWEVVKCK